MTPTSSHANLRTLRSTTAAMLAVLSILGTPCDADPNDATNESARQSESEAPQPTKISAAWQDDAALRDIAFADRDWGWAVGDYGTIWHTRDAGETWALQSAPVGDSLASIAIINRQQAIVVGGRLTPAGSQRLSQGVVLATHDGGAHWESLPTHVPSLAHVQFFGHQRGVAVGLGSSNRPSGMFVTTSGGRTWQPLRGGQRQAWLAADFLNEKNGVAVGVGGRAVRIESGGYDFDRPLDAAGRSLRDVALTSQGQGWLVGDGGVALVTRDFGRTWQLIESLPANILADADLLTVAAQESHVWIAGSPGSFIFHSSDNGRSWERQSTGITTPVRRLTFVDPEFGWAVGDLGVVLRTRDGGATWESMRGEGRKAAVLNLTAKASNIRCETLSDVAADGGYRTVVHVMAESRAEAPDASLDNEARLSEAVQRLGAHSASYAWQFGPPSPRFELDPTATFAALDRRGDGQTIDRMRADLVRRIRQWRPDVVLLPSPQSRFDEHLDGPLHAIAYQAIAEAADSTTHQQLMKHWNLAPWKVQRIMAALPVGERGVCRIDRQRAGRRLGRPLVELGSAGRALLAQGDILPPGDDVQEFGFVSGSPPSRADDLLSGLSIPSGSAARRAWEPQGENPATLRHRQLALKRHNLRSAFSASAANPAWLTQAADLANDLDVDEGATLLEEFATRHLFEGKVARAAEMRQALVRRYNQHPLADAALLWLVQFYASSEASEIYLVGPERRRTETIHAEGPADSSQVELASANGVEPPPKSGDDSRIEHLDEKRRAYVAQLVDYATPTRPELAEEPALRFAWAASLRQGGDAKSAERYFAAWERRERDHPWRACAMAEQWLGERSGSAPLPTVVCRMAAVAPHLDGILNEDLWQTSTAASLKNASELAETSPAAIRFGYDDDYLYLALEVDQFQGIDYPVDSHARYHDAPLEGRDRVRLLVDVDRDYTTAYELIVDSRGFTGDRFWGNAGWNPEWFVANRIDGPNDGDSAQPMHKWQIEAAIPWSALVSVPPKSGEAWALAIERIVPGHGFQTWRGAPSAAPNPQNFGLLLFE